MKFDWVGFIIGFLFGFAILSSLFSGNILAALLFVVLGLISLKFWNYINNEDNEFNKENDDG